MSNNTRRQLANYIEACVDRIDSLSLEEATLEESDLRARGYEPRTQYIGVNATTQSIGQLVGLQIIYHADHWRREDVVTNIIGPVIFTPKEFDPVRAVAVWQPVTESTRVSSDDAVE
ncbi:hypothetical protein KBD20_00240 [Candidatus Saccharibacteria bacterium]|nr:hypothetical protein [Candidatus Saccharibacteria bacterium]